ncbi:PorT family protein [bacterium]|nr:PorT family protein [bacterium]
MKRTIILLLAAAIAAAPAGALLPSFGVKGGVNMANYSGSDGGGDLKLGAVGGAFLTLDLIAVKIQPELLYSQKGAKEEGTIDFGGTLYPYKMTAKVDYLEVPVLLKYSFGAIVVPSVYFGPSFGILMSAKGDMAINGVSASADIKDAYNGTDIGLVIGAEVKTPVKLSIEARYTMGLTNAPKALSGYQPDAKNSTISVMLGYYLF